MLKNPGLRKSVEQPVLDLNFAASQIGSNGAPDGRMNDFNRGSNAWFVDSDGLVKKSPHNLILSSETIVHGASGWLGAGASLESSPESPDGIDGSTKVTWNGVGQLYNLVSGIVAGQTYQFSYYVKLGTKINNRYAVYDHTNTTFIITSSITSGVSSSEWTRVNFTVTAPSGCTQIRFYPDRAENNSTETGTTFITGVQVSQHSTLPVDNPYLKTTGSAVYAARLDHDPTWFMSAAQEQNLLQYSEMLDDSYWSKTRTTVTANALEAPDGTVTAELLSEDTSSSNTHILRQSTPADVPQTAGKSYVFSGYLKAGGRHRARIRFESSAHQAHVNLIDGTINNLGMDSVSLTDEGNGWFRFAGVQTADATNDPLIQIMLIADDGSTNYTGDGSSGVYVWGLQLEVGTSPSTYHRTEGAPYYGEGATPKGLLIEEARTNLLTDSDDLTVGDGLSGGITSDQNAALGLDGTVTAAKLKANSTTPTNPRVFFPSSGLTLSAADYTYSIFLKKAELNWVKVRLGVSGSFPGVFFDLDNGTVGTASTGFTGKIVEYGNGWYRCSITAAASIMSASTFFAGVHLASADNTVLTSATVGDGVFMWGHLLEVGSFPTSYIETTGASATRNADVATMGPTVAPDNLGPELVTNGTFDTDTTGWFANNVVLSATPGQLNADDSANAGNWSAAVQELDVVTGRRYRVSFDIISLTATVSIGFRDTQSYSAGANNLDNYNTFTTTGTKTVDLTADATKPYFVIGVSGTSNAVIDNVSVKEILPGTERVTNGTFDIDGDETGWQDNSIASTVSNGVVALTCSVQYGKFQQYKGGDGAFTGAKTLHEGRRYRATVDVTSYGSGQWQFALYDDTNAVTLGSSIFTSSGTKTFDCTMSDATNFRLWLTCISTGTHTASFDNVSVRELYPFEQYRPDEFTTVVTFDTQNDQSRGPFWLSRGGASTTGFGLRLRSKTTMDSMVRDSSNFNSTSDITITPAGDTVAGSYQQRASDTRVEMANATQHFGNDTSDIDVSVDTLHIGNCLIGGSDAGTLSGHIKRIRFIPRQLSARQMKDLCDD
jgi:hypothetical protein